MKHTFLLSLLIVSVGAYAADKKPTGNKIVSAVRRFAGADDNASGQLYTKAVNAVAERKQSEVKALFEQGGLTSGDGLLHLAAANADEEMVALLLSLRRPSVQGMDLDATFDFDETLKGWTPLTLAAIRNSQAIVQTLHGAGASLDKPGLNGHTALHTAVRKNSCELVRLLLDLGASSDIRCEQGLTPLHLAALVNVPEAVSVLAPRANCNLCTSNGCTPLVFALRAENEPVATALITAGAPVNSVHVNGYTAAHVAARLGLLTALGKLLECANCNVLDNHHQTPLIQALMKDQGPAACMLINGGVQLDIADDEGNTALHIAAEKNMPDVVGLLIEKGACSDMQNVNGKLPIDLTQNPAIISKLSGAIQTL